MRTTLKTLERLVEQVNGNYPMELHVFPNMYGYGIAPKEGIFTNLFNGSAKECEAFLQGMLTAIKVR